MLRQVLLVILLGIKKRGSGTDFGGDGAESRAGQLALKVLAGLFRQLLLLIAVGVNGRAVLCADIVALAHALGGVVMLPEGLQQVLVGSHFGVENDLDDFGVP